MINFITYYSETLVSRTPVPRSFCVSNFFFSPDHLVLKLRIQLFRYIGFPFVEYFFYKSNYPVPTAYYDSRTRIYDRLDNV
jgi:hypothetical protein